MKDHSYMNEEYQYHAVKKKKIGPEKAKDECQINAKA
jgi:hypothetical protein